MLQATTLAEGGDVFMLDMGEPDLIKALAEQMVRLSGLSICDSNNSDGEIEIVCTGLKPAKLYEQPLIEAESRSTIHPLILSAKKNCVEPEDFCLAWINFRMH